jgi:hypothetical protein
VKFSLVPTCSIALKPELELTKLKVYDIILPNAHYLRIFLFPLSLEQVAVGSQEEEADRQADDSW